MRLFFTLVMAFSLVASFKAQAQNVFNPNDVVNTYNGGAPSGSATNPTVPANGVMAKWVRSTSPDITWNTDNYKCYIWNGLVFRLRFPNNYTPGTKYPVALFLHGIAEGGNGIYDNEYQLKWGGRTFEERINYGEWNGFLLFPQQRDGVWGGQHFPKINDIIDTLQKYNSADPDRLIVMGLSSGGYGTMAYASAYPQRTATAIPSSPVFINGFAGAVDVLKYIPVWEANGGLDGNPWPNDVNSFVSEYVKAGGIMQHQYYGYEYHSVWFRHWDQTYANGQYMLSRFWNNAHKAQPLLYFGNDKFCPGTTINARMGVSSGFNNYEWQKNTGSGFITIGGANSNEYTATETGQYRVRFKRTSSSAWSDWSPSPINITVKASCINNDTLFAEHFNAEPSNFNAAASYARNNFNCGNGIITNGTENINRDGTGANGGRFLVGYTNANGGCSFTADAKIWENTTAVTVIPNTNYVFSFYMANQITYQAAQVVAKINGVTLGAAVSPAGEGNNSWTRYIFTWNSGANTTASISLHNNTTQDIGNDYAIDEITLTKAPAGAVPVQLVSFFVSKKENAVLLQWNTANENNNKEFIAEHSIDGIAWSIIGAVAAQNNINGGSYNFTHIQPVNGLNYYRLKQVDMDGKFQYLPVRRLVFGKNNALLVYPNPAKDVVSLQNAKTITGITIYNQTGQLVLQVPLAVNTNTIELNVGRLKAGVYTLQVIYADKTTERTKLVKE
ncbi:MAG: hypothetical protein RLZZ316_2676 [Bacteroidota bacterium]